jgi:hypothetical protein
LVGIGGLPAHATPQTQVARWGENVFDAGWSKEPFEEIAAGWQHTVARRSDGSLAAWGRNYWGQCTVPALPLGLRYVEVAAGGEHTIARRSEGSVLAWGKNQYGQCDVPALPPGVAFVEVAAGKDHSVARRSDGTVVAWGWNAGGQCDVPPLPAGITYVQVAAGFAFTVARRSDGSIVAWGNNDSGQCDVPPLPSGIVYLDVASGLHHAVARRSDGLVVAWGSNTEGQCNVPPLPIGLRYAQVSAGLAHTVARRSDGSIVAWGGNGFGQCDVPGLPAGQVYIEVAAGTTTITWTPPVQITDLDPIQFPPPTQGDNFPSIAIDADGTINVAWFRWNLANECHILFERSDGTPAGWASAVPVDVTVGANFDRFPHVVRFAADDLRIYFGSSTRGTPNVNDIFVTTSSDDGANWSTPAAVATLNTPGEQSQFPTVVKLANGTYAATRDRWALATNLDLFDPSSDVFYAESSDGDLWTVDQVTNDPSDDVNDFVPELFFDHDGATHLAWSTVGMGDPAADIVEVLASGRAQYPASGKLLSPLTGVTDHSPRVVALTVGGRRVYVMVWVRIVGGGANQVGYRVFTRL